MSSDWKRFYLIRVPIAALVLAAICQLAAILLVHVPMLRNRSDELAAAIQFDHTSHRIVLLGDSVIRNSTSRYSLGHDTGDVLNLSTHGALGLPGEYFLLQRYLEAHPAPAYVVLSLSPEVYFGFAKTEKMHYYMWYTFERPDERAFLKKYLDDIDSRDHYPAVLDPQGRIVERFYGLFRRSKPSLSEPVKLPDRNRALEPPSENLSDSKIAIARIDSDRAARLRSLEAESLAQICRLSAQYSFQIRVVWPPAPKPVADGLLSKGVYSTLEDDITQIFDQNGCKTNYFNMNSIRDYVNFHRDAMHPLGEGWEERVASDLRDYLVGLPDHEATRKTITSSASLR
jgi:hypothetical protein